MIEVCFFEVYLKAVSLCMCRLLLSIIFCNCTCLFSLLNIFPPCSPNSFSLFCIEKSLVVPGSGLSRLNRYFKKSLFTRSSYFGVSAAILFTPEFGSRYQVCCNFGIVEISHQSQKRTTFFF